MGGWPQAEAFGRNTDSRRLEADFLRAECAAHAQRAARLEVRARPKAGGTQRPRVGKCDLPDLMGVGVAEGAA